MFPQEMVSLTFDLACEEVNVSVVDSVHVHPDHDLDSCPSLCLAPKI